MFIEQGIRSENKFWKYLLGSILIIGASFMGQLPLLVGVMLKTIGSGKIMPDNENDLMKIFDPNTALFLIMISFVFAVGGIYLVIRNLHKQTLISIITSRKKIDWKRIIFSFIIWALLSIVSTVLIYFDNPKDFVINFQPLPFLGLLVIATLLIPIQTTCEELVFRGYLMQGFGNLSMNKWFPLLMTSVIFGSMHIFNPEVEKMGYIILIYYIGTGLMLGIMTLMDEGLELSLGFHAANNLIGALLVTSDWSALQTNSILKDISEPSAGIDVIIPVVVVYPILLWVFSKKYQWNNWKEKLTGNITTQHEHTDLSQRTQSF
ncbi:MAG: CPBP family intramembrane metalloprotease [Bacteroidetes bacterium]|nr:CPBP family intramembrane metalloprotease [Bacteroidota bacterium]